MRARSSIAAALISAVTLCACSSSTVTPAPSDGGGGDDGGGDVGDGGSATRRVTLSSQLGPGDESGVNDSAKCQLATQTWVVIGDNTHPVYDGATQTGMKVSVECRVAVEGSGFIVAGRATLDTMGSVEITGHFDPTGVQSAVHAVFTRGDTGSFVEDDCTASYAANRIMGVAAGRVWATLTCPHATFSAQSRTCLGTAEFRFENCSQK